MSGVSFEQDGHYYSPLGQRVVAERREPENDVDWVIRVVEDAAPPDGAPTPSEMLEKTPPEKMTDKQLRALLEMYGEKFTTRAAALALLSQGNVAE